MTNTDVSIAARKCPPDSTAPGSGWKVARWAWPRGPRRVPVRVCSPRGSGFLYSKGFEREREEEVAVPSVTEA